MRAAVGGNGAMHKEIKPVTTTHTGHPPDIRRQAEASPTDEPCPFWRSRTGLIAIGFMLIAGSVFLFEHRIHVLGYLPFLLLLACPLMHMFMHRGHGHGSYQHSSHDDFIRRERRRDFDEEE
jgi:hypothetical protein